MTRYKFATVKCACGLTVHRVPPAPGRKACACGLALYFVEERDILQPFAEVDDDDPRIETWDPAALEILGAGKEPA